MLECYQQGTPLENEQKELKIGLQKKSKILVFSLFVIGISWVVTILIQIKER